MGGNIGFILMTMCEVRMSCDHGLNQRVSPPGRAGAWQVRADRALSLRPGRAAVLSIRQGGAWVTLGQGHGVTPATAGDRFLMAGDQMLVPAGTALVMESLNNRCSSDTVYFDWDEATLPQADDRFSREVSQPAQEVAQSLARACLALIRLISGVLGYADYLVANRGRVPGPLESMRS